jgi:hypothetical protein
MGEMLLAVSEAFQKPHGLEVEDEVPEPGPCARQSLLDQTTIPPAVLTAPATTKVRLCPTARRLEP